MIKVQMPMLGLTMSEGTIRKWFKVEGEPIAKGEPLFEIETDKATLEVEAPTSGVLLKILAATDQTVPVGDTVAHIGDPAEQTESAPSAPPRGATISPRARRLAEQSGINWRQIAGTGGDGQITEADVQARVAGLATVEQPPSGKPLARTRQIIAERLRQSHLERVHIYLTVAVNMTVAARLRAGGISYNDMFLKSLAIALTEFPVLNSSLIDERLQLHKPVDIGIAVAVDDAELVVPVLRGVEGKTLDQIAVERRALVAKALARRLTPDEMSGGTFSLSNLGMYGVEQFTAIINPPQSGILAVGAIADEPGVVNGAIVAVPTVRLTLGVDHRVVDGALAAKFVGRLKDLLEQAGQLKDASAG